jgi:hypothetical protein
MCDCFWFACPEVPNKHLSPECYSLHESMHTLTSVITHLATQYAECQKQELKPQTKEERGKRMEDLLFATYLQVPHTHAHARTHTLTHTHTHAHSHTHILGLDLLSHSSMSFVHFSMRRRHYSFLLSLILCALMNASAPLYVLV